MSDTDDYCFSLEDSSSLSSVFEREKTIQDEGSDLIYRAPKQPTAILRRNNIQNDTPKLFYKFIKLYNITDNINLGKYIIGIVSYSYKLAEMLIYQSKKDIFIRLTVNNNTVLTQSQKNGLNLETNEKKWLLQFEDSESFEEFCLEFGKINGRIENPKTDCLQQKRIIHRQTVSENFEGIERESKVVMNQENISKSFTTSDGVEQNRDDILARLSRMGLPKLPSPKEHSHDEIEDSSLHNIAGSTSSNMEVMRIKFEKEKSEINKIDSSQYLDPTSIILSDNYKTNFEMCQQMMYLNSRLCDIQKNDSKILEINQLTSKLKAFKVKSENLEDELSKLKKEYYKLQIEKKDVTQRLNQETYCSCKNKPDTCQTTTKTNFEKNEVEDVYMKEFCNFIKNSPTCSRINLEPLMCFLSKNGRNSDANAILQKSLDALQNRIDCQVMEFENTYSKMKIDFTTKTKNIMSEMYSNICSDFVNDDGIRKKLADCIRNATMELIDNFEKCIENDVKKYIY